MEHILAKMSKRSRSKLAKITTPTSHFEDLSETLYPNCSCGKHPFPCLLRETVKLVFLYHFAGSEVRMSMSLGHRRPLCHDAGPVADRDTRTWSPAADRLGSRAPRRGSPGLALHRHQVSSRKKRGDGGDGGDGRDGRDTSRLKDWLCRSH